MQLGVTLGIFGWYLYLPGVTASLFLKFLEDISAPGTLINSDFFGVESCVSVVDAKTLIWNIIRNGIFWGGVIFETPYYQNFWTKSIHNFTKLCPEFFISVTLTLRTCVGEIDKWIYKEIIDNSNKYFLLNFLLTGIFWFMVISLVGVVYDRFKF